MNPARATHEDYVANLCLDPEAPISAKIGCAYAENLVAIYRWVGGMPEGSQRKQAAKGRRARGTQLLRGLDAADPEELFNFIEVVVVCIDWYLDTHKAHPALAARFLATAATYEPDSYLRRDASVVAYVGTSHARFRGISPAQIGQVIAARLLAAIYSEFEHRALHSRAQGRQLDRILWALGHVDSAEAADVLIHTISGFAVRVDEFAVASEADDTVDGHREADFQVLADTSSFADRLEEDHSEAMSNLFRLAELNHQQGGGRASILIGPMII